ncbi:protein ALP1-like [Arachis duranensis]|uniref:Protein ALP1-like n=1 Tax=Arachis duranensis TaxID=130453 RepID=A0A6P4DXB4_ARADU|nr:protein ALP1-like [Arachis duranensis]
MEIGSAPPILTLEDYSYLFPDMDSNFLSLNKKRHRNEQDEEEEEGEGRININNNINIINNSTGSSLNDLLSSLIHFDNKEVMDPEEMKPTIPFNPNHHNYFATASQFQGQFNEFKLEVEGLENDYSGSPTKKARRSANSPDNNNQVQASAGSSSMGPQRRLWVKDRSKDWWERCSHPDFPEEEFRRSFRMSKGTFEMICRELDSAVTKKNTMLRDAIPVRQRVAVCIWRLATGDPLRLVSKRFGLGISTCHKLVLEVCSAIKTVLMPKFLHWPDESVMKKNKEEFESVFGIPDVGGSMYTTHVPIIAPKTNVAAYFNKRHTERNQKTSYSITVQGVVDPRGVFTDVCIGWPGSMPDDQVLEKSALFQRASKGSLKDVWVVGNSGHPLMDWILVPYTHQNLTWTQHAFNEKIGDIQKVAKGAFSRLKGRWSCLQKRTEVKLQDLPVVLGACCVLHNICEMRNEEMDPDWSFDLFDDEMVAENGVRSAASVQARDQIAHYLLHHGRAGTTFL